jgi:GlnD PII-uridylyltransferase
MTTASLSGELRDLYTEESARIQQQFAVTGDGSLAVRERTRLVETIALRLWREIISRDESGPPGFTLVALGGFGRGWLFPHSDVDILFLHAGGDTESACKDPIRRFSQEMWDLHLKLSPATRVLSECDRFDAANVEFTISLLDCRYLAGDRALFDRLHDKVIPKLVMREAQSLVQSLAEVTRSRHAKYGNTVFHLEPNVKDGPGGLRDDNVACSRFAAFSTFARAATTIFCCGNRRTRQPLARSAHRTQMSPMPRVGCAFTSARRDRCIACARSCWKKFRPRGRPFTASFSTGDRGFRMRTSRLWTD